MARTPYIFDLPIRHPSKQAMADSAVPVIDMQKLGGAERGAAMAQIARACEDWGFFQLLNHGVPPGLLDRLQELCKRHYRDFLDTEFRESAPVQRLRVSADVIDDADWESAFFLHHGAPAPPSASPSLPGDFREAMEEYAEEIRKLAERILEVMCENLGLEKGYLKEALSGGSAPFFGTKVSHYPPCPRPELVHGLRPHTDAGGIILLFQDDKIAGLQLLRDGRWIDVQPLHHAIVIDIGDQIEVITNGKYRSVWHRVLATEGGNRMSIASFYNPADNALVCPAPDLRHFGGEYPQFVSADYMRLYARQKFLAKEPRFEAMRTAA